MRCFVSGDIHGDYDIWKLGSDYFNKGNELNLTKDDYLIICGDFGLVWDYRGPSEHEKYWLNWLEDKPWTTLFVDGNHECFSRLNNFEVKEWNGGKVHKIRPSIIHLMRGQVFNLGGKKFFTMGGAQSHDKKHRKAYESWWPEEIPNSNERMEAIDNLYAHDWKVDYVITHEAPTDVAEEMVCLIRDYTRSSDEYTDWLQDIANKLDFKQWFFGHYHYDLEFFDETLLLGHNHRDVDNYVEEMENNNEPSKVYQCMYNDIVELKL